MGLLLRKVYLYLDEMSKPLRSKKVVPVIGKYFSFVEAIEVLRYYGNGRVRGTMIISMENKSEN